jgi:hypothetical protein
MAKLDMAGAERHDLGRTMPAFDVGLDRPLHDAPFAHAELVALAVLVGRFERAFEDVIAQRPVIGCMLTGTGRHQDLDVEAFVAEETFVARDQERQVVHGIHHR